MNRNDSATAQQEPVDYTTPNDLEFELTPEQEQDFVKQVLENNDFELPPQEKVEEEKEEPEVVVEPEKPVEKVDVAENKPTEITEPQTDDLWIETDTVVLDELGEPTVEKIKLVFDPKDPDSFIPENFKAKNDRQLAALLEAKQEMVKKYAERETEYSKQVSERTKSEQYDAQLKSWNNEIDTLISAGILEAPKLKPEDEGYGQDPAVQKTDAVFKFMVTENAKRAENGTQPIESFGVAFTLYEKAEAESVAEAEKQKEIEDTKRKSAMIGGGSSVASPNEAPVYKSGQYGNIYEVPIQ